MYREIVDLSVPICEGMPEEDLGPKFWVRLSYAASRQTYNDTQSREGRVFLTTDHVGMHMDAPLRKNPGFSYRPHLILKGAEWLVRQLVPQGVGLWRA